MTNYAIALNLNPPILGSIESIWQGLHREFNINYISSRSPFPHITLCAGNVSEKNENDHELFIHMMQSTKSFELQANGYGVLMLDSPLIYVRWVPNKRLIQCVKSTLRLFKRLNATVELNYQEARWFPKTTLAYMDTCYNGLEEVLHLVRRHRCDQSMSVDTLSLLSYTNSGETLIRSVPTK